MRFSRLVSAIAIALAAVAGCSSTKLAEPSAAAPATAAASTPSLPITPARRAQSTVKTVTLNPLDDSNSSLAKRSVYFDFDSFLIHDADLPLINAHAKYLTRPRSVSKAMRMNAAEGNTTWPSARGAPSPCSSL